MLEKLKMLIMMLQDSSGKGDKGPEPPQYREDPATTALKGKVSAKTQGLLDIPYEDLVSRFTPGEATQGLFTDAVGKYKGLIDSQDYGIEDYTDIENSYLDSVLGKYTKQREQSFKPIQESLIAENLYGSGPGYGIMSDYADETSTGVGDISKQWAYEGIARKQGQMQYMDALKRGDYSTMYNLALSEASREIDPQVKATEAEAGYLSSANGLFGQLTNSDNAKYQAEMAAYNAAMAKPKKNMGGLGAGLGMGLGALFALPTGGLSLLAGSAIGGGIGGGVGSMIEY